MESPTKMLNELLKHARSYAKQRVVLILLTTVIMPSFGGVIGSILANQSYPSTAYTVSFTALMVVVTVHILLAMVLIMCEVQNSEFFVAKAVENEHELAEARGVIDRTKRTNDMLRLTFEALNRQTCDLEARNFDELCSTPFQDTFRGISQIVLESIETVFGLQGKDYTLEIWYQQGFVMGSTDDVVKHNADEFQLVFFHSPKVLRSAPLKLKNCAPVFAAKLAGNGFTQTVKEAKHLFCSENISEKDLYFSRYAVHPLRPACNPSTPVAGAVVLTSMQEAEFDAEVLASLAFIGSVASNLVYRYNTCYLNEEQRKLAEMLASGKCCPTSTSPSPSPSPSDTVTQAKTDTISSPPPEKSNEP